MANILDRILGRGEARNSIESPKIPISSKSILSYFGISSGGEISASDKDILGIPAVWAAVNFLSRTLAALPLHHYVDGDKGPTRQKSAISALLNGAANDELSSFALRQWFWARVFTTGRGLLLIERDARGNPTDLFPLEPSKTTIKRPAGGARTYHYKASDRGPEKVYQARDVIDVAFMLEEDGVTHSGPLSACREAFKTQLGAKRYGGKIFRNGGLPAVAITGPFTDNETAGRAADDLAKQASKGFNEGKPAIALPHGHELKAVGIDPQKMQMTEYQRFLIEDVARIFQLPPLFLHELTRATFSNAENADLHLEKHVITQWLKLFEGEADLKFFGRENYSRKRRNYLSHNVDGLRRGDYHNRMEGHAKSVQNAIRTPNEVRALEGLPALPDGDSLLIQGATVPLGSQPLAQAPGDG